jgi:multisubunit Na+/H+ antiporter MnhG subunit
LGSLQNALFTTSRHTTQDLTEEVLRNGMARLEIKNETLRVDWIIHLLSQDIKEDFKNDSTFKKLEEVYSEHGRHVRLVHSLTPDVGNSLYTSVSLVLGVMFLILGCAGLFLKIKDPNNKVTAKIVKSSTSIWCILVGVLLAISEVVKYHTGYLGTSISAMIVLMLKVSVMALKFNSIIVYSFQSVMIFHPFYFRQHEAGFSKWIVRLTLSQWVFSFFVPVICALVFIFAGWDACDDVVKVNKVWKFLYTSLIFFGYSGSLICSLLYLVGYVFKNRNKPSSTRKADTRNTMMMCFMEIVYDCAMVALHGKIAERCGPGAFDSLFQSELAQPYVSRNICDSFVRINILRWGLPKCYLWILVAQQLALETVFVTAAIVERNRRRDKDANKEVSQSS